MITAGSEQAMSFDGSVYIDANVLIYAMETDGELGDLARRWLVEIDQGHIPAVTSELTLLEVLPHPMAAGHVQLVDGYRRLLTDRPTLQIVPLNSSVLNRAIDIRAEYGGGAPDAIHTATALVERCAHFLTNDIRLKLPPELDRLTIPDIASLQA